MNLTEKIIITDTNVITDLFNADLLEMFSLLNNVYILDIIKESEINSKTCNMELINKIKVIHATSNQILEMEKLAIENKKLSPQDLINYVVAKENNYILATGDNRLKIFSEKNGVEVLRTLKIIKLMNSNNIINKEKAIEACLLLRNNPYTRIPLIEIDNTIDEIKKLAIAVQSIFYQKICCQFLAPLCEPPKLYFNYKKAPILM